MYFLESFILLLFIYLELGAAIDDRGVYEPAFCTCNGTNKKYDKTVSVRKKRMAYATDVINPAALDHGDIVHPIGAYIIVEPLCTGTIVNRKWVVASAFCGRHRSDFRIQLGKDKVYYNITDVHIAAAGLKQDLEEIAERRSSKRLFKVIPHPLSSDIENDIALYESETYFEFGEDTGIYPACFQMIELRSYYIYKDQQFKIVGYGDIRSLKELIRDNVTNYFITYDARKDFESLSINEQKLYQGYKKQEFIYEVQNQVTKPRVGVFNVLQKDRCDDALAQRDMVCMKSSMHAVCRGDEGSPVIYTPSDDKAYVVGHVVDSMAHGGKDNECGKGSAVRIILFSDQIDFINKNVGTESYCYKKTV